MLTLADGSREVVLSTADGKSIGMTMMAADVRGNDNCSRPLLFFFWGGGGRGGVEFCNVPVGVGLGVFIFGWNLHKDTGASGDIACISSRVSSTFAIDTKSRSRKPAIRGHNLKVVSLGCACLHHAHEPCSVYV
jgi:hypothetical protein